MESSQLNNQPPSNEDAIIELLTLTCEIDDSGTKHYYNKEGQRHRIHGPAVIWACGIVAYYRNNKLHRYDGPAVTYTTIGHSEHNEYWIDGKALYKHEFDLLYNINQVKSN